MAIFRGDGGSPASNTQATLNAVTEKANEAAVSAQNAETSEDNAATSATNAATSATNAAASATSAETAVATTTANANSAATSASNASTSASNALSSSNSAATSATAASNSATAASTSATNAANSAAAAATSATNAANSATSASTSATNAASSASAASTSASNAAASEAGVAADAAAAAASASSASTSATNAANSAASASSSATSATASATSATSSASAASTSASNAATSETNAGVSETNAAASESAAATSESNAATSESNAATSASNAATSETNASNSASAAATSEANAAASFDSFDDRYLGAKASDPTLDNDGDALITGALYFNTTSGDMKVYNGSAWLDAYASITGETLDQVTTTGNTTTNAITVGNLTSTGIDDNATSTAITIDASGHVGIGTTTPNAAYGLDVVGNIRATSSAGSTIIVNRTSNPGSVELQYSGTQTAQFSAVSGGGVATYVGSTPIEAMRVDASGRVGISTATFDNAAQVLVAKGDSSVSTSDANASGFNFTAVPDTTTGKVGIGLKTYNETASAVAALYATPVSQYRNSLTARYNADSGGGYFSIEQLVPETASVQERMRIDPSGRVGIGTASPSALLDLVGGAATPLVLELNSANSNCDITMQSASTSSVTRLRNGTNDFQVHTNGVERMRLDASGRVGIGTTTLVNPLTVNLTPNTNSKTSGSAFDGGAIRLTSSSGLIATNSEIAILAGGEDSLSAGIGFARQFSGDWGTQIKFYTHGTAITTVDELTERMRLDANGNLLIGTTSAPTTIGGSGFIANPNNRYVLSLGSDTSAPRNVAEFRTSLGLAGRIEVQSLTTDYVTSSDVRLKDNIVDAPAGNIDSIKVRSFDWKADGSHQTYGMVAQELVDVAPEAVSQGETEDDMWGVDYSKLVPMMIKEIQDLKAEVAALKGA
jgi:hypothetical protein